MYYTDVYNTLIRTYIVQCEWVCVYMAMPPGLYVNTTN